MKKYTQKLLAFLLALAMAVPSVPMNAKAADERVAEVITLDFCRPTTGVLSNRSVDWGGASEPIVQGIAGTYEKGGDTRTYTVTNTLAGTNWRLVPSRTIPALAEGETKYPTDNTGFQYFMWTGTKSDWGDTKTARTVFYVYGNKTISFDFDVLNTKEYQLSLVYYDTSSPRKLNITVDPASENPFTTQFLAATTTASTKMVVEEMAGSVVLTAGTHTVDIQNPETKDGNETMIRALILTEVLPPVYESATFNLEDGAGFLVGNTFELDTTAVLDNGTDISDEISVAYTSNNTSVAAIEGNTLSLVGRGKATITAEVSYAGEVKQTLTSNVTVKVDGEFKLDFREVNATTIQNDGKDRLYFTDSTKSTAEAATQWSFVAEDSHKDTYWPKTGLRYFHDDLVPTYLRVMSSGDKISTIQFTAPASGTYNVVANILPLEAGGYLKVFVNDVFVGVLDAALGNEKAQNLLGVALNEGANTISFTSAGKSTGTNYYCNLYSFDFVPVAETEKNVITGLTATINGADSATFDIANGTTGKVDAIVETTGDVKMWPTMTSKYTSVVSVQENIGTLTIKNAGHSVITVTAGDFEVEIPVIVEDSRPRYTVIWMNGETSVETDDKLLEGAEISYDGVTPVKEGNAQYSYTFTGWNTAPDGTGEGVAKKVGKSDLTYYAQFEESVNKYLVTFIVDGETVSSETYDFGTMPVVPKVSNKEDADKVYTFKGWDKDVVAVTGEATYTAVFEEEVQNYTITFRDEDGGVLAEYTVAPGDTVEFNGETPTKISDPQYHYEFAGWTPEVVSPAVGNAEYEPVFTPILRSYEITWVVGDKEITETYAYGATPVFKGETAKASTPQYTYEFTGWDVEPAEVKGEATYTAQYEETLRTYTITFKDEDGSEIKSEPVAYGEMPTCEDPVKAEDVYATYEFAGWSPEVVKVEKEAIYTATYKATPKTYTVTWLVNGTETTTTVEAGQMPEAPEVENYGDVQYTYVFTGWDKEFAEVTEDVTYTAQFTQTVNKYAVTFINHNGDVVATEMVAYGETPEAPTPTYKEYTFLGWDKDVVAVEGEATYTAIYDIDGIDEGYYYVDGKVKGNAGVIQIGEDLYFVCYSGKIAAGQNMTVPANKTNNLVAAGTYYFYADGTMKNPADDLKGEIVNVDGTLWYYVKGEVRGNVGLVEIDGLCYYVHYSGKVVAKANQTVTKTNGFAEAGTYYFYANGVMATDAVKLSGEVGADGYYYVYDELTKNVGLVELANGDYVYVHYSGKVVQNGYQTVTEAKANGFTQFVGVRKFADGVMVK